MKKFLIGAALAGAMFFGGVSSIISNEVKASPDGKSKSHRNCWWTIKQGDVSCGGGAGYCTFSGCRGGSVI
jgi:uncharacterized membrane protein